MGVAGSGKTHIGAALGEAIGASYLDGDDLHPGANVEKMRQGVPLTDDDRWPWLQSVGAALAAADTPMIVGCSALKRVYRDCIRAAAPDTVFIYLNGTRALIHARMGRRKDHFMPLSLLDSQFDTLEVPGGDEAHVVVDIDAAPIVVVDRIVGALAER